MTKEYDNIHRQVWSELVAEMESFGITDYSIFRRGQQLFLYMRVLDYKKVEKQLVASDVNQRWQEKMAPLFEVALDIQSGENQAMMHEVFFMPGKTPNHERSSSGMRQVK